MRRWLIGVAVAVLVAQVAILATWSMKPEAPPFLERARRLRIGMTLDEANTILGSQAEVFESTDNEFARCRWEVWPHLALMASVDGDMRVLSASYTDFGQGRMIDSLFDETVLERLKYDFGYGGTPIHGSPLP